MQRTFLARLIAAGLAGATLTTAGCASTPFGIDPEKDREPIADVQEQADSMAEEIRERRDSRHRKHDTPFAGVGVVESEEQLAEQADWLQEKISLSTSETMGVNAAELARMFRKKGLTISSSLPLDSYSYNGFGVEDVPIINALRVIFGAMGLDYRIDHENKFVEIQPMGWKTWNLNLGNRVTAFNSGGAGQSVQAGGSSNSGTPGNSTGSSGSSSNTQSSAGGSTTSSNTSSGNNSQGGSINVTDDFWTSLEDELEKRMTMLIPSTAAKNQNDMIRQQVQQILPEIAGGRLPPPQSGMPGMEGMEGMSLGGEASGDDEEMYRETTMGRYALNRETGAVSVQAPRWVQEGIEDYIEKIEAQYNTTLEFKGRLFLVSSDQTNRAGVDLSAFADFAENYGLYVQNNALGGVTVSKPDAGGLMQAAAGDMLGSSMVGIKAADNTLQVFNAFLEQRGEVAVIQEPSLSTTSGVPATFSKFNPLYYNTVTQDAAVSEGGGAVVGTQNEITRVDLGTRMSINPRYDAEKRMVRAQIDLDQVLQSGTQVIDQTVSATSGGNQTVPVEIPVTEELSFSGETLLRDGDLIIMGGQKTTQTELSGSGVTGVRDMPGLGSLFGKRARDRGVSTYYFALQVVVNEK